MGDTLPLPRFEQWNPISRKKKAISLEKYYGITIEKDIAGNMLWINSPEQIDEKDWSGIKLLASAVLLHESVVVDPDIRGGVPVIRGTRISLSQLLTEISDGETVAGFADEYDIDGDTIRRFFEGLAIHLDRSFPK